MLDRLRTWLGVKFIHVGITLVGGEPPSSITDLDEPDEEPAARTTYTTVELNDHARKMVQDGLAATPPTRVPTPSNVLAGSVQARVAEERRRRQEAMRPRKG